MNIGSKNKKRAVLPSRPDPPTVEQVLEDINRAFPNDPVFSILDHTVQGTEQKTKSNHQTGKWDEAQSGSSSASPDSDVESKYQQGRRYLELNEKLQEVRGQLVHQREELRAVGEQLDRSVAEVKGRAL